MQTCLDTINDEKHRFMFCNTNIDFAGRWGMLCNLCREYGQCPRAIYRPRRHNTETVYNHPRHHKNFQNLKIGANE